MSRGLVIGKFYPLHKGHIALIDFALANCDEVVVGLCIRKHESLDFHRRKWLEDTYYGNSRIEIVTMESDADLPSATEASEVVSRRWASYIVSNFGVFDYIVTSEEYGKYMADYMGAKYLIFDQGRQQVPISGSNIRLDVHQHWKFLADVAKEDFIKTVCIYGPESTGKSTLTDKLASHYNTLFVPEVARDILGKRHCRLEDFPRIAIEHAGAVFEAQRDSMIRKGLLFVDTDILTTQIYLEHYFPDDWATHMRLLESIAATGPQYDLYLLLRPDVPWVADIQRDLQDTRDEMFNLFQERLEAGGHPYANISGTWEEREELAIVAVEDLLRRGQI